VRQKAEKLAATFKTGSRPEVLQAYRPALALKGDPAKGKAVFQKTCAACHRLDNFGTEIGPNLVAMQNRGAEAILSNVIDPNLEVNPQFVEYLVDTKDGRTLTGLLDSETANSVTLKRSEGATDTVLRADITKMRSTGLSIMPEGLEQQLDVQAMADLIAYLMTVK
jgi:putative heme-binding domain-containing protein